MAGVDSTKVMSEARLRGLKVCLTVQAYGPQNPYSMITVYGPEEIILFVKLNINAKSNKKITKTFIPDNAVMI